MTRTFLALAVALSIAPVTGLAQSMMSGVDMQSPAMTEAEFTRADVEALIAEASKSGTPVALSRARLNGVDLSGLDLTGANLRGARLNGADLSGATLDHTNMDQVWGVGLTLDDASLKAASLFQAQLIDASILTADFTGARAPANFADADLTGTTFAGADLGADTKNQSMGLMRGDLSGATARGVDFSGANLLRVILEFADLRDATFDDANLATALLAGADLTGASVNGTAFEGADVTSTRLVNLKGTKEDTFAAALNYDRAFLK